MPNNQNDALRADSEHRSAVENAYDYIENFDILETITNVGNDEVFTPAKVCNEMLDALPDEVWHNPNYKWLNPCSKNGIFEREIAIRLDNGLRDIIPDIEKRRKHILQNMIYAIGLTKFTSYVARRTLYYCSDATRKCDGIMADDGHYVNGYAIGNGSWFDTPEGNIKTPDAVHKFGKDGKCVHCGVRSDSKYVDPLQREQYAYQFIHFNHPIELQYWLADTFFNGDKNMKFDIIIGNPPYQLSDGGGTGTSAMPIYQLFVEQAKTLEPRYISMIIPARWFAGGKGLDDFRNEMLHDNRIKILADYFNAEDCFPGVDISGGVCHFLWDRSTPGDCSVVSHIGKNVTTMDRPLLEKNTDSFIRFNQSISILRKVQALNEQSFETIVSARRPFGLNADDHIHDENDDINLIKVYAYPKNGYVSKNCIRQNDIWVKQYKVLVAKAYGERGDFPYLVIGKPFIGEKETCCTETYLVIGPDDNLNVVQNIQRYMTSRFFRFLVLLKKNTQNAPKGVYQLVPMQDFSKPWTDKELYEKYGLDQSEIDFIESMIRPME
ncbi:MAG: Eco57I restriction-modification methylase domain-containing protein [Clostridiales bacterium]|nr:Eco57I restriction-modification methylase domain-containing protein [Clostridiales bacterium]